jgi:hypothetical protein
MLPPYPFPSKWEFVNKEQSKFGESYWLTNAPNRKSRPPVDFEIAKSFEKLTNERKKKRISPSSNHINDDKHGFYPEPSINSNDASNDQYRLELNSMWASRLSKTLKKIKNRKKRRWHEDDR